MEDTEVRKTSGIPRRQNSVASIRNIDKSAPKVPKVSAYRYQCRFTVSAEGFSQWLFTAQR
jgi:hypothetical protein